MKSLTEYLSTATHYLCDMSSEYLEKERQKAIAYCEARNLDGNFRVQVELMPDWLILAKNTEVKFFIEEPLKQNPGSSRNAFIQTGIFLRIFDQGQTPVIKVVM